jgi:cell division protease FtsH
MSLNTLHHKSPTQSRQDPELDDAFEAELTALGGVQTAIAKVTLEAALGPKARQILLSRSAFVVVVHVPAPDWCDAVCMALTAMNTSLRVRQVTKRKRTGEHELGDDILSDSRGDIRGLVLVTHDPVDLLTRVQLGAADVVVTLPTPTARLISRVIRRITGQKPRSLTDADVEGLTFHELAAAIRLGSSAAESTQRLRRAKSQPKAALADSRLPRIEDLPLTSSARSFSESILDDLQSLRRGEIKASQLQNAVLTGPPGTGKTLLAGAIARSVSWPFIRTSVGDWFTSTDGYLNGVMKGANNFFDELLKHDQAIGFIDEIDSLPNRSTMQERDREWWTPVVNIVLTGIDRVKASGRPILLLGATNFGERLDMALTRPGRFDRIVPLLPPSNTEEIAAVFRYYLKPDLTEVDIVPIALLADGATPAQIEAWVKQARRSARSRNRPLELIDLTEAVAPADNRNLSLLEQCAIHEAGHAVIARALGISVKRVTILQTAVAGGTTTLDTHGVPQTRGGIESMVMVGLAGRSADELLGHGASAGAAQDLQSATHLLASAHAAWGLCNYLGYRVGTGDPLTLMQQDPALAQQVENDLKRLKGKVDKLVAARQAAIMHVANGLLQARVLNADDIDLAIESSGAKPFLFENSILEADEAKRQSSVG